MFDQKDHDCGNYGDAYYLVIITDNKMNCADSAIGS